MAQNVSRETPAEPVVKRPHAGHAARLRRIPVAPPCPSNLTLCGRALHYLYPWLANEYPGRIRGLLAVFDHRVTYQQIYNWSTGRKPLPAWAARHLADKIRARVQADQEALEALLDHADARDREPKRVAGFAVIGADGRDKRGRRSA